MVERRSGASAVLHCLEAEQALLGCILLDNAVLYQILERISPQDFFSTAHQIIFAKICEIVRNSRAIDPVLLPAELSKEGLLEKVGGVAYLAKLTDGVPIGSPPAVSEYCRIVKEKAQLRSIFRLGQTLGSQTTLQQDVEGTLVFAESSMAAIRENLETNTRGAMPLSEVAKESLPILERTVGSGIMIGTSTGFPRLDELTAGWIPGELVILAARPSRGKTALGLEFALRAAKEGRAVVLFSLEMSRAAILMRMVCREAKVESQRLRRGFLNRQEWERLTQAMGQLSALPIWIDDRAGVSAPELRHRMRSLARRIQPKLVVVDYLQLLKARGQNRTEEVTRISIELKAAARDLGEACGATLLAVAQLNRVAANERPKLHHLRESGQLEQDADAVLLLSDAEGGTNGQIRPSLKVLEVSKQRNGPCGSIRLLFLPVVAGFEEASTEEEPNGVTAQ